MPSRRPWLGTAVILILVVLLAVTGLRAGAWTGAGGVGLGVSLVCWPARSAVDDLPLGLAERTRARISGCLLVAGLISGVAVLPDSSGISAAPAIAGLVGVFARSWFPPVASLTVGGVAGAELVARCWSLWTPVQLVSGVMGMALAACIGLVRRQRIQARRAHELMLRQDLRMREDAGRAELARELHDLLAHGLGGLVTQLDAAGALLEAGRRAQAADRIETCRKLASDSLREAREAVAALRQADATTRLSADALWQAVRTVIDASIRQGEHVESELLPTDPGSTVPSTVVAAFTRITQEALANARAHAPGATVHVELSVTPELAELTVRNAPAGGPVQTEGEHGFGLVGMRERLAQLDPPGDLSVSAGREFTVTARAPLPDAVAER